MQRFEIWSAGSWPEVHHDRMYHGARTDENFQKACYEFAADNPLFARAFKPHKMTWDAHKLYPSEQALIDSFTQQEA